MNIVDFPFCCTAHILTDFGESAVAEGGNKQIKEKDLIKYIKDQALKYDEHAVLTAITNSQQKTANKALRKLGFNRSKWMNKKQHSNTKIRLWYKHINELLKNP